MTEFISEAGFYAFLRSCDVSLAVGLIGVSEHRLRLSFLRNLIDPGIARFLEWDWPGAEPEPEERRDTAKTADPDSAFLRPIDADGQIIGGSAFGRTAAEPELILRLITGTSPTQGSPWLFHQSDCDWFPSVPHGHLKTANAVKLDCYRGCTYDTSRNNRLGRREDREFIARLWNETAFRALATNALRYFCDLYPHFDWIGQRGIVHPMVLPRFRQPR